MSPKEVANLHSLERQFQGLFAFRRHPGYEGVNLGKLCLYRKGYNYPVTMLLNEALYTKERAQEFISNLPRHLNYGTTIWSDSSGNYAPHIAALLIPSSKPSDYNRYVGYNSPLNLFIEFP